VIAVLCIAIYAIALIAGLPLGLALFGRRHPAAWIAGGVIGYALTLAIPLCRLEAPITLGHTRHEDDSNDGGNHQ